MTEDPKEEIKEEQKPEPTDTGVISEIAWGEDPIDLYRRLRFSLRVGQRARVAVLDSAAQKAFVHFAGFYFYCTGKGCLACLTKPPSPRYLTWILFYTADADGKVVTNPLGGVIKAWMFGRDKYGVLSQTAEEWGDLRTVDLQIDCTDEKFQRFTISVARDCLWQQNIEFAAKVITMLKEAKVDVTQLMARTITNEQMIATLAGRDASGDVAAPSLEAANVPDITSGVQTDSAELQNLLDQLQ